MISKMMSFVPALLVMCMIFYFSSQTGEESSRVSLQVSKYLIGSTDGCFAFGLSAEQVEQMMEFIHVAVRKLGHVIEYFILAVTVAFPLYVNSFRGKKWNICVAVFCVLFAALDEFHQSFVAERGPSIRDVGIDSIGILLGIVLANLVCRVRNRKRRRKTGESRKV